MVFALLLACGETLPVYPPLLDSDAGLYSMELSRSSDAIAGVEQQLELDIEDDLGPALGLELVLTPWMPEHGHGLSEDPVIEELGEGIYALRWTYPMAGWWELTLELSGDAGEDTARWAVDVG